MHKQMTAMAAAALIFAGTAYCQKAPAKPAAAKKKPAASASSSKKSASSKTTAPKSAAEQKPAAAPKPADMTKEKLAKAKSALDAGKFDEAFNSYRTMADEGVAEAQFYVGTMYDQGKGISQDAVEAAQWYKKSAERGFARAQLYCGYAYDYGKGVVPDQGEAMKWYLIAERQGGDIGEMARINKDELKKKISIDQFAEAQKQAKGFKAVR